MTLRSREVSEEELTVFLEDITRSTNKIVAVVPVLRESMSHPNHNLKYILRYKVVYGN